MPRRSAPLVLLALTLTLALTGCGNDDDGLVLYNAQNGRLMGTLVDAFTEETGIEVQMRNGGDTELGNQLVTEGSKSPADVFTTENSTAMAMVDRAGLFTPLEPAALEGVAPQNVADDKGWVGVAARSTVMVYNTDLIGEDELPASMLDLEQPQWKGMFGYAPSGADFQAIASAVYAGEGDDAGQAFVDGLAANGKEYANNIAILKAVNSGEIPTGIIYHYYWFQDQADTGDDSDKAALHYFGNQDPGAYLSVAGAGVLASSDKQADAQKFVAFLTSKKGQEVLSESNDFQYAINNGVPSNPELKPISELDAPIVPLGKLDGPKVLDAFREAGIL